MFCPERFFSFSLLMLSCVAVAKGDEPAETPKVQPIQVEEATHGVVQPDIEEGIVLQATFLRTLDDTGTVAAILKTILDQKSTSTILDRSVGLRLAVVVRAHGGEMRSTPRLTVPSGRTTELRAVTKGNDLIERLHLHVHAVTTPHCDGVQLNAATDPGDLDDEKTSGSHRIMNGGFLLVDLTDEIPGITSESHKGRFLVLVQVRSIKRLREKAELIDQFNELIQQQRYVEAEELARRIKTLLPNDPAVSSIFWKTGSNRHPGGNAKLPRDREVSFWKQVHEAEQTAAGANPINALIADEPERIIEESNKPLERIQHDNP